MKRVWLVIVAAAAALSAQAQDLDVAVEQARITAARTEALKQFATDQKACQARFAVTRCVEAVQARQREALADLRRQEVALNAMERKARAADSIKRQEARREQAADTARREAAQAQWLQREAKAAQKAEQNAEKKAKRSMAAAKDSEHVTQPPAQQPVGAAAKQARHEARLRDAQAHREAVHKRNRQHSKPPAGDLPTPSAP